jgi:hypothetical protein
MPRLLLLLSLFLTLLYLNDLVAIAGNAARIINDERSSEMPLIRSTTATGPSSSCSLDRSFSADGGTRVEQWIGSICIWLSPDVAPVSCSTANRPHNVVCDSIKEKSDVLQNDNQRLVAVRMDVDTQGP